jgi:hypothetical protein
MSKPYEGEKSSPFSINEEEDQWITDAISLTYRRQADLQENPHHKLQRILARIPSPASINLTDPLVAKAFISMRDFLKGHVIEVGKSFDGDIPEPMHHHWMGVQMAFENLDMDKSLGRDATADLKIFLEQIKTLNNEFLASHY